MNKMHPVKEGGKDLDKQRSLRVESWHLLALCFCVNKKNNMDLIFERHIHLVS